MRKLLLVLICTAISMTSALAQKGLNNNSNLRVPVPGSVGTTAPFIRVIVPIQPTMPSMPGIPSISPVVTLPSGGLLPAVPANPSVPKGPTSGVTTSSKGANIGQNPSVGNLSGLPSLPSLPPVSPIPPLPQLKLSIPRN
jgi:hypothetical protein